MGSLQDIQWAPRIKQELIRRLYELDARGIQDEELIDEIGWGLRARCVSFIGAVEATRGRAPCPKCAQVIRHTSKPEEVLVCAGCGWSLTWKEYFSTIQHKQLSGADPILAVFEGFVEQFPRAHEASQKMLLIDRLLHSFHFWVQGQTETRAAAVNFIEGRYHEVIQFLDQLTYGAGSTPGLSQTQLEWQGVLRRVEKQWAEGGVKAKPRDIPRR